MIGGSNPITGLMTAVGSTILMRAISEEMFVCVTLLGSVFLPRRIVSSIIVLVNLCVDNTCDVTGPFSATSI